MARKRARSQDEVTDRCDLLRKDVRTALALLPAGAENEAVIDAVWRGEALGTLLWALQLAELPPYDRPFSPRQVVDVTTEGGELRPAEELELERESARLWHWRARTSELQATGGLELPPRYSSVDQLIAATAMRGHQQGILPGPARGDFRAFGRVYRQLAPEQLAQAHSLAAERHHALNWLCGLGDSWDDVPLDT